MLSVMLTNLKTYRYQIADRLYGKKRSLHFVYKGNTCLPNFSLMIKAAAS
jgi:hypothetical protein